MLIEAFVGLINLIIKALGGIANALLTLLPPSPFTILDTLEIPYLDNINWIIPVSTIVTVTGYWIGAVGLYYVVQVVLRWIKVIE